MVTLNNLRSQSSKDLAKFARSEGIPGWHNMRKEQLIQALTRLLKRRGQPSAGLRAAAVNTKTATGAKAASPHKVAVSSAAVSKDGVAKAGVSSVSNCRLESSGSFQERCAQGWDSGEAWSFGEGDFTQIFAGRCRREQQADGEPTDG